MRMSKNSWACLTWMTWTTAHDVFVAMQEIPFTLKTQGVPESKLLALQENMARALTINWRDYDYAKEVKW